VRLGDPVTFQQELQSLLRDRVTARAFDNKAGVFIMAEAVRLLKERGGLDSEVGVHAVATVQEELVPEVCRPRRSPSDSKTSWGVPHWDKC
jgi:endoglucanase